MTTKTILKTAGVISCAVLLTVALVWGATTLLHPTKNNQPVAVQIEPNSTSLSAQTMINSSENYIGEAEAKSIALTHAGMQEGDVSYMLCKLDYDNGVAEYEIEFWDGTTEYDYEINAISGKVTSYDYDMESYNATPITPPSTTDSANYIGEAEAKSIALTHAGIAESDVSYMLCKLDYDNGIAEYEVEFWNGTTEYDYDINAISGEITSYDYDMESYNATPVTTPITPDSTSYIGEDNAKAIAFTHAGVAENEASFIKCEFDFDDGNAEYEVEWKVGMMEYEYTISAIDGTILERDVELD